MNATSTTPPLEGSPRGRRFGLISILVAVVALLTVGAAVGGLGYAVVAGQKALSAIDGLVHLGDSGAPQGDASVRGLDPGRDQYGAGFSLGDPGYNHAGPPRLRCSDEPAPPMRAELALDGKVAVVSTCLAVDEQALLRIDVLTRKGVRLPLVESNDGGDPSGLRARTLEYWVLVPRVIHLSLRLPLYLLRDRGSYVLRVRATDHDGNTSTLRVRFLPPA